MGKPDPMILAWLPIVASATALIAVFVGPLIFFLIAKRQTAITMTVAYRSVVSPMRQKWIDGLRDRVSEFMSIAAWFYRSRVLIPPEDAGALESSSEWDQQSIKMVLLKNQIELMLNPKEKDHNEFLAQLDIVRQRAWENGWQTAFPEAVTQANALCKEILKDEWDRVKSEALTPLTSG
jgi:hypothetical protein